MERSQYALPVREVFGLSDEDEFLEEYEVSVFENGNTYDGSLFLFGLNLCFMETALKPTHRSDQEPQLFKWPVGDVMQLETFGRKNGESLLLELSPAICVTMLDLYKVIFTDLRSGTFENLVDDLHSLTRVEMESESPT